jgi:hypothetical protein
LIPLHTSLLYSCTAPPLSSSVRDSLPFLFN